MKRDIAIIGMAGRFPKSDSLFDFWKNLLEERELIHFFSDAELEGLGVEKKEFSKSNYVKASSYIEGIESFDYSFFKYTPAEVQNMNPQTRVLHQIAWEALEDAGCDVDRYKKRIGIFAGANNDLNWSLHTATSEDVPGVDWFTKTYLSDPSFMASMVAYKLNLKGPCYYVDTACSTSLSAAHLACRSLLLNECSVALVGGVRVNSFSEAGYLYEEGMILSRDGHCRAFDAEASGTIGAEGAGVIVIKRLEEAINDNDQIYAVIKASALNNDGNRKAGYTMPSVDGQAECIKLAHKIAGVQPSDISYIEAHGTATKVGDPIEVASLNYAFNNDTDHKCYIGSVKANLGHADEAAGVISIIKTALALKNKVLPASIGFRKTNPAINFNQGPFTVNQKTIRWKRINGKPLTAGVNCFGVGGTNVHLVMQEPVEQESSEASRKYLMIRYSAQNLSALERYEGKLLEFLEKNKEINLPDLAYSLQVGRKQFNYAKSVIAKDVTEAIKELKGKSNTPQEINRKENIVFMFPGQGSQYYKMGIGLYEEEPYFREILDNGFKFLAGIDGINYKDILFNHSESELINKTRYTQPILFLFEYALAKLLINWGIKPNYLIGHSLGEYSAAAISEVFSFHDALRLVSVRAKLMDSVEEGCMISIGMNYEDFDKSVLGEVSLAAINSSSNFVLSGVCKEIEKIESFCSKQEIPCVKLKTSHAFHSKMMQSVLKSFKSELLKTSFGKPTIPYYSNVTGQLVDEAEVDSLDYWTSHLLEPVLYEKGKKALIEMGNTVFLEVGPGRNLSSFFKQINEIKKNNISINVIRHPKDPVDDRQFILNALSELWVNGYDLNWEAYYSKEKRVKISAPNYAFGGAPFPVRVSPFEALNKKKLFQEKSLEGSIHFPSWKFSPLYNTEPEQVDSAGYLIFAEEGSCLLMLQSVLKGSSLDIVVVRRGDSFQLDGKTVFLNPESKDDFLNLSKYLNDKSFVYSQIVYCWGMGIKGPGQGSLFENYSDHFSALTNLLAVLNNLGVTACPEGKRVTIVSKQNEEVIGGDKTACVSHLEFALNFLTKNSQNLYSATIDVDDFDEQTWPFIFKELRRAAKGVNKVALRRGRRWEYFLEQVPVRASEVSEVKKEGVYLLIGDLDLSKFRIAKFLLEKLQATVFWVYESKGNGRPKRQETSFLKELEMLPGKINRIGCKLINYDCLSEKIKGLEQTFGPVKGVIYSYKAGPEDFSKLIIEDIEDQFKKALNEFHNLYRLFRDKNLDFFNILSSISDGYAESTNEVSASYFALLDDLILKTCIQEKSWSLITITEPHGEEGQCEENQAELVKAIEESVKNGSVKHFFIYNHLIDLDSGPKKVVHELENREQNHKNYKRPITDTEKQLVELFEVFFGISGIGIEDNIFDFGLDSLKAISISKRIEKKFKVEIPIDEFYQRNTIYKLSETLDEKGKLYQEPDSMNHIII